MDQTMFGKMKAKPGMAVCVLNAPEGYPGLPEGCAGVDNQADLVHLFVKSQAEFRERIAGAMERRKPGGLFWISYPKSAGKVRYDINRDSLWDVAIPCGVHPVAQVALDEEWSALRLVDNKPGETYERPGKK